MLLTAKSNSLAQQREGLSTEPYQPKKAQGRPEIPQAFQQLQEREVTPGQLALFFPASCWSE